ncbi:MAG: GDP-mannose 4,6-dehydratase [Chloroflexi bacterium]|nr:GDP-mannose 4,6-dehydratase [Chloroflexota bacterium]
MKIPSRRRALITGAAGFAGSHLAEMLLADADLEVWGCYHRTPIPSLPTLAHLQSAPCDMRDAESVRRLLADVQPNWIFHLAGQSDVGGSWGSAWDTIESNVHGQLNVLEALAQLGLDARVLVVGSNNEYGLVRPADLPLDEDTPLRPDSPYGVSKIAQDMLGLQFFLSHGVRVVRARCFNYIGPRQSPNFVTSTFAKQIAEIEAGRREPVVRVGNLAAERDFTDVRDMVRAQRMALEFGADGEVYNIGSGRSIAIQRLLDILLSYSSCPIRVEPDAARMRPSDVPRSVCDATKFRAATGWQAHIPIEQTLRDVLDYWRQTIANPETVLDSPDAPAGLATHD